MMNQILKIRIDQPTKRKFFKTAKKNDAVVSEILREWIEDYVRKQQTQKPPKNA